jgi:O-antigen/teichoic acid export membrane protein
MGNYRLDQWLLGAISGPHALGLYSVAVSWSETLFYLPTALVAAQRPDLVRASRGEAGRQTAKAFRIGVLLTLPVAAVMIVVAPLLCATIFGHRFSGSVLDLRLLVPGAFGITALKMLGNALIAQGRPVAQTVAVAVAFGCTALLDAILIPLHADLGASLASTIAYSAGGLAAALIFVRTLGCPGSELIPQRQDLLDLWRRLPLPRV